MTNNRYKSIVSILPMSYTPEIPESLQRPQGLEPATIGCLAICRDLFENFDVSQLDVDKVREKSAQEPGQVHGLPELYYTGREAWQGIRESLPEIDFSDYFSDEQSKLMQKFTFREATENTTESFIQSTLTAPTIFAAWYAEASGLTIPGATLRQKYNVLPKDLVQSLIAKPWFVDMLREGSKTSNGLYRNSTGFSQNFKTFLNRAVAGSLRRYRTDFPEGAYPVQLTDDERQDIRAAELSADFREYLKNRIRVHNARVWSNPDETPTQRGLSRGCPVAAQHIRMSEADFDTTMPTDVVEVVAVDDGQVKLRPTWDPYRASTDLIGALLAKAA